MDRIKALESTAASLQITSELRHRVGQRSMPKRTRRTRFSTPGDALEAEPCPRLPLCYQYVSRGQGAALQGTLEYVGPSDHPNQTLGTFPELFPLLEDK